MSDLVFPTAAAIHPNGVPENLFAKAHEQLKQDLRQSERRTRNWQRHCGILALALFAALAIAWHAYDQIKVYVYLVEVANGEHVRNIGMLPQGYRGFPPPVIDTIVRSWLHNIRRVGIDPVMNEESRHDAGAFMTMTAIRLGEERYREVKEMEQKGWTTQVKILSSLPMTPDARVLQIEWQETTYTKQGTVQSDLRWRVIANIVTYTEKDLPKDLKERQGMRNKIGIFVEDYAWQPL